MALKFLNDGYFAGTVGIGTETPQSGVKLDVRGNVRIGDGSSAEQDIHFNNSTTEWQVGTNNAGNGTDNNQFYFYEGGNYRLTVQKGGNVGIGTTSPGAPLTLNGNGQSNNYSGVLRIFNTYSTGPWSHIALPDSLSSTSSSNNFYLIGRGNSYTDRVMSFHIPTDGDYGSGAQPKFGFYNTGAVLLHSIEAETGTSYFKGNVGIGTTSPNGILQFANNAETRKIVLYEGANNDYQFYGFGVETATLIYSTYTNTDDHVFVSGASSTTRNELMRIEGGGNVGIGTDSPAVKLHIKGAANGTDGKLYITEDASNGSFFKYDGATNRGSLGGLSTGGEGKVIDWSRTGSEISFLTGNVERMRVNSSGNVGIGTTSPTAAKLVVSSNTAPQLLIKCPSGGSSIAQILLEENSGGTQNASITFDQAANNTLTIATGYVSPTDENKIALTPGTTTAMTLRGGDDSTNTAGAIQFNGYVGTRQTGTPTYLLGTDASGNIVKTNTVPGSAAGPYLPLAGGVMTGPIDFNGTAGDHGEFEWTSGNGTTGDVWSLGFYQNSAFRASIDFFATTEAAGDGNIRFKSGNITTLTLDSSQNATFAGKITSGNDIVNATAGVYTWTGDTDTFIQRSAGNEITFKTGASTALVLNSSQNATFAGDVVVDGGNITIDTDTAGNSLIWKESDSSTTAGQLRGYANRGDIYLYASGVKKTEISASTDSFIPALHIGGTTAATGGVLQVTGNAAISGKATSAATITSDGSSTLTTKGYVNSLITGATIYRGTWDPDVSLNSGYGNPNLNTVTQTSGYYYICSADGAATPNGATTEPNTWNTGDWVIWNDDIGASGEWQKIDNSSVLSGVGTGQTVALWEGLSTVTDSETLGNAPITVSGNNTTFAGLVSVNNKFKIANNGTATWGAANDYGQLSWDTGYALIRGQSNRGIKLQTNSSTTALTLDTSQNATFAGQVNINSGNDLRLYRSDNATYARFNYAGGSVGLDIDDLNGDGINLQQAGVNKLRIETTGNATFAGTISSGAITSTANISGVNLIASTAVYSGGIFYGSSTLSLKKIKWKFLC